MATSTPAPRLSPERIFGTLTAYQQTAAMKAAIETGVFTAIGEGAQQPAELAKKTGAAERGVRILCDYLVVHGFLTKANGKYALTQESAVFLDRKSPAYIGSMTGFLLGETQRKCYESLTEAVRKGGTAEATGDHTKAHEKVWVEFARSMANMTGPSAGFLAKLAGMEQLQPAKVLDIAAGHGMFGITLAKINPNAEVTALDWPAVLEVAKENAAAAGVAARFHTRAGSAFDTDLGDGYDAVLLTNILHHFDMPTCEKLMRRVHAALKPGGKAITLEFVPNEDRVTPPMAAAFSLIMLASTDAGDAYTFSEYDKMFANAGFSRTTLHPVPDMPQQALVSEK